MEIPGVALGKVSQSSQEFGTSFVVLLLDTVQSFLPSFAQDFSFRAARLKPGTGCSTGYSTGLLHLREDSGHHRQVFFLQRDGYRTVLRGTQAD